MGNDLAKVNTACLIILAGAAITAILSYTKIALVPLAFALFIYSVALPAIHYLQSKLKLPRIPAIAAAVLLFLILAFLVFFLIFSSLESFFQSAHVYKSKILELVSSAASMLSRWDISVDEASVRSYLNKIPLFSMARNITGGAMAFIGNAVLVMVFVTFLLLGKGDLTSSHSLIREIQQKVSKYVATKSGTSILTGIMVGALLTILQVQLAFMFAVLTVLFNFIPNVGSIVATLLPLPVVYLQYGLGWQFIFVLVVSGAIQFSIGNIIEPKIMGESMDLHPVTVLVFLVFWGLVWGIPGMFLAVPITAVMKIALGRIPTTRSISELLAGRIKG